MHSRPSTAAELLQQTNAACDIDWSHKTVDFWKSRELKPPGLGRLPSVRARSGSGSASLHDHPALHALRQGCAELGEHPDQALDLLRFLLVNRYATQVT